MNPDIYSYVKSQEARFETDEVQVGDNWYWNFRKHVQLIFHLKNGVFFTGSNDFLRAFKAVMHPILDLAKWTEDIDVKDIVIYTEESEDKVYSFILKKYHDEVYTQEHDLDMMIDEINESDIDYGGTLVQRGSKRPEVIVLNSIAFCDQTDILGGAIGFKFFFSPDKLRGMSKYGWGNTNNGATISLDDLCVLANASKETVGMGGKKNDVPSKTIEVYVVRGTMPEGYLEDNDNMEDYYGQLQIVAFYTDTENNKVGVTLYRKKDNGENLKFLTTKKVYQRALGMGYGEMLLHPQVWANCLTIYKMDMLQAGSKVPLVTDDPTYTQKNKIQEMETLEITTIEEGKTIKKVPTMAVENIQMFEGSINEWYSQAQLSGSAFDPIMGKEPPSGTTFRGQERNVAQGRGSHDKRRGQRAKFIEEIYHDWTLDDMINEITSGTTFLATLSTEDLNRVIEQVSTNEFNKRHKEALLEGKILTPEEQALVKDTVRTSFMKKGNKHTIKVLKGQLEDFKARCKINVAGKQKDLANMSDKLLSIFQFVFANPQAFQQAMQNPALAKAFENILEASNMSIADFSTLVQSQPIQQPEAPQPTQASAQPTGQAPQLQLNQPA